MDSIGILTQVIPLLIEIIAAAIVIPVTKNTLVPWLKEKHLYTQVQRFVRAAEKLGATGAIDKATKKAYVVSLLQKNGVTVTDDVDAMIEAAVEELDEVGAEIVGILGGDDDGSDDQEETDPEA
jgi:hypothetical protein